VRIFFAGSHSFSSVTRRHGIRDAPCTVEEIRDSSAHVTVFVCFAELRTFLLTKPVVIMILCASTESEQSSFIDILSDVMIPYRIGMIKNIMELHFSRRGFAYNYLRFNCDRLLRILVDQAGLLPSNARVT